jgi:hypothetical protein
MAAGIVHFNTDKKVALASIVCGGIISYLFNEPQVIVGAAMGSFLGILLTNDIDQPGSTYNEYLVAFYSEKLFRFLKIKKSKAKWLSRIAKQIFMALTAFYAMPIKHRSFVSHLPPISTITKLLYIYGVYYCITKVFGLEFYDARDYLLTIEFITLFIVYLIHDFMHLYLDGGMILDITGKHRFIFGKDFYNNMKSHTKDKEEKLKNA